MKNKRAIYLLVILILLVNAVGLAGCATTFKGRVIDADTKEPIEGAVVVAKWNEEAATVIFGVPLAHSGMEPRFT